MENLVKKLSESKFMKALEKLTFTLSSNKAFSSISEGMGGMLGIIMIGSLIQVALNIGQAFFGLDTASYLYTKMNAIYTFTLGCMSIALPFNIAYVYARKLKMNGIQAGFTALVIFFLVCTPIKTVTADGTSYFTAISLSDLGVTNMFVGMVIGLTTVAISKFCVDHNFAIKMSDMVPEGIVASFNSIIPTCVNIVLWYGATIIVDLASGGTLTLSSLLTTILSYPINYLLSPVGYLIISVLSGMMWFLGIHGSSIVFTVTLVPYMTAFMTNAALAQAGQPLQFSPVFLTLHAGASGLLPLVLMGLRSKSERISTVCKAALPASVFSITEPMVFGLPIMYNAYLFIPFVFCDVVLALIEWVAYSTSLISLPQVLFFTPLPIFANIFAMTLDWRNVVFALALVPLKFLIWYPFFKIYEKKTIDEEQEAAAALTE